jgi:hypothetical protein
MVLKEKRIKLMIKIINRSLKVCKFQIIQIKTYKLISSQNNSKKEIRKEKKVDQILEKLNSTVHHQIICMLEVDRN